MEVSSILINLFILFAAAKIAGEIFKRFSLPEVVGELLIGIVIGPGALAIVAQSPVNGAIATLGVMILLFAVGLETRVSDIRIVGIDASIMATSGIAFPFILVFVLLYLLGATTLDALFIATATTATSVGITARVLTDLGALKRIEGRIILGAAVLDDILGLLVLSAIVAYARTHTLSTADLALVVAEVMVFMVFVLTVAPRIVHRHESIIKRLKIHDPALIVAIITMLGLSALSSYLGLAAIVGAFFAGMIFAETEDRAELEEKVHPIYEFLVPFFFVVTGTLIDVRVFTDPVVLGIGVAITVLAIAGKVLGGMLLTNRIGRRHALAVGVGMVPRGEVGFIVASIGFSIGAISQTGLSEIIFMAMVTTAIVPPLLPLIFEPPRARRRG